MFLIPPSRKKDKTTAEVKEEQEQDDQKKKPLSVSSQAFNLFLEGKSVVKVAIELDLPTDQALKIHSTIWYYGTWEWRRVS